MVGLSSEQWGYAFGMGLVGVFPILLLAALFSSAFLGGEGNRVQRLWIVILSGVVGIGLYGFGEGEGGFVNRITNVPKIEYAIGYSISTLIVGALTSWWQRTPSGNVPEKRRSTKGRIIALAIAIPIVLLGFGNLAGGAYVAATEGIPSPGLGVSRAEMRQIMLNGDLAPFWRMVDEKAPLDMDYIIERMFANEDNYRSTENVRQQLNKELLNYRTSLATYGPALSDQQRIEIIESALELLRAFEDRPELCVDVAMTGGQGMTREQLLVAQDLLNRSMIVTTENLIAARDSASEGAKMPNPPTQEDFGLLRVELVARGMSEDQLEALSNEDSSHPDFCSANIGFLEVLVDLEGPAGEALRFEITQALLTARP